MVEKTAYANFCKILSPRFVAEDINDLKQFVDFELGVEIVPLYHSVVIIRYYRKRPA